MERESSLIEKTNPKIKYTKENTIFFWKTYCKRFWSFYLVTGLITVAFVIWYILYPDRYLLFYSILYPILMAIFFFLGGIYRNIRYKKRFCNEMKDANIEIHSTFLSIQIHQKGSDYISRFSYDTMNKIEYKESTKQIIFRIDSNHILSFGKDDIQQETFDFLTSKMNN